jgi:hypothetical protein
LTNLLLDWHGNRVNDVCDKLFRKSTTELCLRRNHKTMGKNMWGHLLYIIRENIVTILESSPGLCGLIEGQRRSRACPESDLRVRPCLPTHPDNISTDTLFNSNLAPQLLQL